MIVDAGSQRHSGDSEAPNGTSVSTCHSETNHIRVTELPREREDLDSPTQVRGRAGQGHHRLLEILCSTPPNAGAEGLGSLGGQAASRGRPFSNVHSDPPNCKIESLRVGARCGSIARASILPGHAEPALRGCRRVSRERPCLPGRRRRFRHAESL